MPTAVVDGLFSPVKSTLLVDEEEADDAEKSTQSQNEIKRKRGRRARKRKKVAEDKVERGRMTTSSKPVGEPSIARLYCKVNREQ